MKYKQVCRCYCPHLTTYLCNHLMQSCLHSYNVFPSLWLLMFVSPMQIAPLHLAAECGHDGIVELLLKNCAPADTEDHTKV